MSYTRCEGRSYSEKCKVLTKAYRAGMWSTYWRTGGGFGSIVPGWGRCSRLECLSGIPIWLLHGGSNVYRYILLCCVGQAFACYLGHMRHVEVGSFGSSPWT